MDLEIRLLISLVYWLVLTVGFMAIWPIKRRTLVVHTILFVALCAAALLNARFNIIDEKVASFLSYEIYEGQKFAPTFMLQYYVTLPAFWATDSPYAAHAVNIVVQSMCFLLALRFIIKEQVGTLAGIALCVFPAYFNFSIFGLRDPYINLIATLFVVSFLNFSNRYIVIASAGLAFAAIFARPEFSVMILGFGVLRLFLISSRPVKFFSLGVYVVVLYVGLLFMPLAFGIAPTGSVTGNIEKISNFNELRNERRIGGDGSGSHILGGQLYSLPFVVRYPIQVAATFITPLPFEIRGAVFAFAFLESLLFTYIAWIAWKRGRHDDKARFLVYCGLLYMLAVSVFSINYGNNLRVRYPAHIFFIGAIAVATRKEHQKKNALRPVFVRFVEQPAQAQRPAAQGPQWGGQEGLNFEKE